MFKGDSANAESPFFWGGEFLYFGYFFDCNPIFSIHNKVVIRFQLPLVIIITSATLIACSSEKTVSSKLPQASDKFADDGSKSETDLLDRFAGGFSVGKDDQGNTRMISEKRSSFEGIRYDGDTNAIDKKVFDKKEYEHKMFDGGNTKYETKSWDGVKNFTDPNLKTPEFITQAKNNFRKDWSNSSKKFETSTSDFQNKTWADGTKKFDHTLYKDVINKRKSFRQPDIISTKNSQAKSIEETRAMMGRDD